LALCAVLVTLGAACGGDDDAEDDDTTPIASAAAATPGASSTAAVDTTPGAEGTVIDVTLNEFSVVPNKSTAPAGSITFRATNEGPEDEHELVVIRSDLAPGDLPTADDGSVPEDEVDFVDEVEGLAVGASAEITVDLAAGKYVLICNIVETEDDGTIESHYQKGMFRGLTVE
jgi:uncharacterized cupredoxin-like copper-binding protein